MVDYKILGKLRKRLIVFTLVALSGWFVIVATLSPALAQAYSCPPGTHHLTTPTSTYPAESIICSTSGSSFTRSVNFYPCDQEIVVQNHVVYGAGPGGSAPWGPKIYIAPPPSVYMSQVSKIRMYMYSTQNASLFPPGPIAGEDLGGFAEVTSYNLDGIQHDQVVVNFDDMQEIETGYIQLGLTYYYRLFLLDVNIENREAYSNLYSVRFKFNPGAVYWIDAHIITSVQISPMDYPIPEMCQAPGTNLPTSTPNWTPPPTRTPIPSTTPFPTWTPNLTPSPTYWPLPTAPGGTSLPTMTLAPPVIITVPAESTPTPFAPASLPTLSFPSVPTYAGATPWSTAVIPTIAFPTIEAADTPEIPDNEPPDIGPLLELLDSDWISDSTSIVSMLDPSVTDTTVISSPNQIVTVMTSGVGLPVSYIKAVNLYMPNTWPYILAGFGFVLWFMFNIIARFILTNLGKILDIVRRVIELIPGL